MPTTYLTFFLGLATVWLLTSFVAICYVTSDLCDWLFGFVMRERSASF